VLDTDTLLLEYSLGTERSYLWVVSTTSIDSFQLPRQADVEAAARRYYELTTAAQRSPQQAQPADRATSVDQSGLLQTNAEKQTLSNAARNLTQMLLEPAASRLGTKRLLIVADGALVYVPFAALPITKSEGPNAKDPPPLIAEHEIVSIPSASTLAILRRETAGRSPAGQVLAVMADPVFTVDDLRVKASAGGIAKTNEKASASKVADSASSQSPALANSLRDSGVAGAGMRIPRLPGTRREALGILAMAPEQERKQAFDFDANRDMATSKELAQYRLVHFATHGLLNSTNPELSGLVLSLVNSQGQMQEGFLRLNEIYNMRLQAELVVLSACQSALGKEVRGEGLIGLTRGFMYAGAARVVASLWKVEDRATAELMRRFYEGILGKERLRAAAALRAAQLSMWKEKRWQEPFYWAAFTLQGEWR
jgi:CHAT domain-containing protein